jgi:hypothetical protein
MKVRAMGIWPFKCRKWSTPEMKRPAINDLGSQRKSGPSRNRSFLGRKSVRRSNNNREVTYSPKSADNDYILLSDHGNTRRINEHQFQLQSHLDGLSSHSMEDNTPNMTLGSSSASPHRPHMQSSFIRRFSTRRKDKIKIHPPTAYQSRHGRQISNTGQWRQLPVRDNVRPLSPCSTAPPTSIESQISCRAYKIRSFDVFSPYPTLCYEDATAATSGRTRYLGCPSLTPSRSNSRRTNSRAPQHWRYKGPLISMEHLGSHRVDDLVDELDAKGLREVMERDERREKTYGECEESLQLKFEKKTSKQDQKMEGDASREMQSDKIEQDRCGYPGECLAADQDARIGYATSASLTHLSWFNEDSSVEDASKGLSQYPPRPNIATPISMDLQKVRCEQRQPDCHNPAQVVPTVVVGKSSQLQAKTSTWTSFIKRATAARIKTEHSTRCIQTGYSTLLSDSEGGNGNMQLEANHGTYLEAENLRYREGQTPGRHVSSEVVLAMNALETGHIQDNEDENEMRDSVLPTPPLAPYHHQNGSQISSGSSLVHPSLGLRGGATATRSYSPFEQSKNSPTIQFHHPQRYTPRSASPENGERSVMSTSLASIDSEGSWLSGKVSARLSVQQIGPLRTSASSLRKRFHEIDNHDISLDDDYFTGLDKTQREISSDEVETGGARLDFDDTDDNQDEVSVNSEAEWNMWRDGMEKRVELRSGTRAMSREGILDFNDKP